VAIDTKSTVKGHGPGTAGIRLLVTMIGRRRLFGRQCLDSIPRTGSLSKEMRGVKGEHEPYPQRQCRKQIDILYAHMKTH